MRAPTSSERTHREDLKIKFYGKCFIGAFKMVAVNFIMWKGRQRNLAEMVMDTWNMSTVYQYGSVSRGQWHATKGNGDFMPGNSI